MSSWSSPQRSSLHNDLTSPLRSTVELEDPFNTSPNHSFRGSVHNSQLSPRSDRTPPTPYYRDVSASPYGSRAYTIPSPVFGGPNSPFHNSAFNMARLFARSPLELDWLSRRRSNAQHMTRTRGHREYLNNVGETNESEGFGMAQQNAEIHDMINRLRDARERAVVDKMMTAVIFYAEKVMILTNAIDDIHALADAYYRTQQYERCLDLLNKKNMISQRVMCRYLAGLCSYALGKWEDVLDYIAPVNPFSNVDRNSGYNGTVPEALLCTLRGHAYLKLNNIREAKKCYKEALKLDVKCYDALDALVKNNLLETSEEWNYIETLPFETQCGEDADLFRTMYMLKSGKFNHFDEVTHAQHKLENIYHLGDSLDALQSKAERLLMESKYEECLKICETIRERDAMYISYLTPYLTCLYELKMKTEIYQLAEYLVDRLNNEPATWYAVGIYYMSCQRYAEARHYLRQATIMNPHYEAAWLLQGHAFAAEFDHEEAIDAYKNCATRVPGSHLPYMYIGMEYMHQNNMEAAQQNLFLSYRKCGDDPFVLNEIGVYFYRCEEYGRALHYLRSALQVAKDRQGMFSPIWERLWHNIGHCYRQLGDYEQALKCYDLALSKNPANSDARTAIGMIYQLQHKYSQAIAQYMMAFKNTSTEDILAELHHDALNSNLNVTTLTSLSEDVFSATDEENIFEQNEPSPMQKFSNLVDEEIKKLKSKGSDDEDAKNEASILEGLPDRSDDPILEDTGDLGPSVTKKWL
ncbi:uncharacterized protein BYT42DRAFT_612470 [Radiomyces spectabilis]|uniref:uncharacterized protein n=1 Tax=Radiomyces spectabilis TaxID=64574 RepID=UPI002220F3D2|nr:uncharacterized protein BYT42DRAFT_612470 [Radiomyces spectabilis]KAI8384797.1 hypothetical protein BYT42DRAFT_612470 [Radiomyces spectabilis]